MRERRSDLVAARDEATAAVRALEAQRDAIIDTAAASAGDDEHDPEGQTIAYDRAQVDALLARARVDVAELDAALERVEHGTYGRCERCERRLPAERLAARPAARTCVNCADLVQGRR